VNVFQRLSAVFRFEWKRARTVPRVVWWVILTAFPPVLLGLVRFNVGWPPSPEPVELVLYILCPGVVCMLGVFLWATPWLSSELEGRSWVYLAVRPHGALSVLLGKYLVAVTWTVPAGLIAATLGSLIGAETDVFRLIWVQWRLVVLSCLAYAAAFSLIGVLFPKRAMVIGVFYAIVIEVVLASIPAAVNLLTIQYRLRCLFVRWLDWDERLPDTGPLFKAYLGEESAAWHQGVLIAMTIGLLVVSALVLRWREFTAESETDV
jgi:hypothetical protein